MGKLETLLPHLITQMELPPTETYELDHFVDLVLRNLHKPTILLFDSIDRALASPDLSKQFWDALRSLQTTSIGRHLAFIATASMSPDGLIHKGKQATEVHTSNGGTKCNAIAAKRTTSLPFVGYPLTLGPLHEIEARDLIQSSPIPCSPADIDWILEQSQCWPLLVQILCYERIAALQYGEGDDSWHERGRTHIAQYSIRPGTHLEGMCDLPPF
jgi:hypothetical protein